MSALPETPEKPDSGCPNAFPVPVLPASPIGAGKTGEESGKAGVLRIPFGKFKWQAVEHLPADYIIWLAATVRRERIGEELWLAIRHRARDVIGQQLEEAVREQRARIDNGKRPLVKLDDQIRDLRHAAHRVSAW